MFSTTSEQVLTIHFLYSVTDRNDSTTVHVYDGGAATSPLLGTVSFRNNSRPQSITTQGSKMFLVFTAEPLTQTESLVRITTGYREFLFSTVGNQGSYNNIIQRTFGGEMV